MLEQIDLSKKLEKTEYKSIIADLEIKLGELQRKAWELKIPIIVVFEGWGASGKGTLINQLMLAMDPRGFTVYNIKPPNEEESYRPFLWRFWIKTPVKGRIAIFDRSWYRRVLVERIDKIVSEKSCRLAYNEINAFEKQLVDDGFVIIKFFLHITQKEQKKRFDTLLKNPSTSWRVTKEDWKHHEQYHEYVAAIEEMIDKTDTDVAPWTVVEAHDRRSANVKVFRSVIDAIERRIAGLPAGENCNGNKLHKIQAEDSLVSILNQVDLSPALAREEYEKALKKYQARIHELEHEVYLKRIPVVIVYQGWDAAGKGGNIKRLVEGMDPRGYEVVPIGPPNDIEKSHHYLWRFWMKIPKAGHFAIFDRSWYGRVLVERIEGFCSEAEWRRAFREIKEMEEHLANAGTIIIKFWLHIDEEEQLRRFQDREATLHKQWKINDEDWRNREKREQYQIAVDEMLFRTNTSYAPWTIIEANCKLYARIKVLKTVIKAVEDRVKS
ncbi:phosphate--AMP phosphotransferase [candidate division KSB1 bacterium]|nr:phosphate--AMP phosphotransferase [candidate division KSB1 bacterium]